MAEVHFTVSRETHDANGHVCRWLNIDACPHGLDLGSIEVSDVQFEYDVPFPENLSHHLVWEWKDLGDGRCSIAPSIRFQGHHPGTPPGSPPMECHFGPGEFAFAWAD
jgi:hypothetical protein